MIVGYGYNSCLSGLQMHSVIGSNSTGGFVFCFCFVLGFNVYMSFVLWGGGRGEAVVFTGRK